MRVFVAEDVRHFDLPFTAELLQAHECGRARGGWAAADLAARGPRCPGGWSVPPVSSVVTAALVSSTAGPSSPTAAAAPRPGNVLGSHIVLCDPVEHRDILDAVFGHLDHVLSDRFPQWLARVVACDPGELRGYTTGTLMSSLYTCTGAWLSFKLSKQAGPNGLESRTVASPWGDMGIHTSGPPYSKAENSSN